MLHAFKVFPRRDTDDQSISDLLSTPGLVSENAIAGDDFEFTWVTDRDRNRAVNNRWPIYVILDDQQTSLGDFRTAAAGVVHLRHDGSSEGSRRTVAAVAA